MVTSVSQTDWSGGQVWEFRTPGGMVSARGLRASTVSEDNALLTRWGSSEGKLDSIHKTRFSQGTQARSSRRP